MLEDKPRTTSALTFSVIKALTISPCSRACFCIDSIRVTIGGSWHLKGTATHKYGQHNADNNDNDEKNKHSVEDNESKGE